MIMKTKKEHFSSKHIDDINCNLTNNYFYPVLHDVKRQINKINSALDVGCGNGVFSKGIKYCFSCDVTGVDGSDYALSKAKANKIDDLFIVEDFSVDNLPFNDNQFDFVMCKDVLEHLISPDKLAEEICRVVKHNGYVLVHVPNHFPLVGRIRMLFSNKLDTFDYFPDSKRWNFPHIRFYTRDSVLDLFSKVGVVDEYHEHFFNSPVGSKFVPKFLKKKLVKHFPDLFSEGITILFQKKGSSPLK